MASNPQTDAEERAGPSVHRARFASGAAGPSVEENPPPEQECRGVRVSLENHRMWREFLLCQTEMVASPEGSRMFPYCRFTLAGLQPSRKYSLQLELGLSRQHRFSWTGTHWETAGPASTQAKVRGRPFTHPDSPAPGRHWMESPVSFYRLKLTDGATPQEGALALTLRHRYQPTLLLLPEGGDAPTASFSFPQTEFMAVSSYHNKELTQLKIHYNPFSKGHAHTDRHTHADHHTHNDRQTRTNNDSEGTAAGVHPVKSLKSLLSRHKARRSESEKAPPTQSSSAPLKLFSELIREAHVSLHRCNVNDLNLSQTSKPPKEQEVVPTDRTPKEPPPSKVGGSPEGQQPKRPARLPLPALALFLKQHSSKTSKRKQQPVPPAETGPPRVCSPSLDSQHTVPPPAPPGPGTVSVAECRRTSPSRPSSNPCGTRWASGVPNASSVHLSDPPPPSPPAAPPPPVSKSAEGAGLLPDPECSSLEFEALSPASSPEPLPSLPSSLTFDLEDPGGPQGATSVFQWHTVLPPLDQIPDHALPAFPPAPPSPQRPSYTDPQEPPSLPFPAELSPLVLSLSPSFSSLDGDGLSPSSSLADLVTLFSNTDDFSTADLTNDHSADPFSTGSHGNNDDTDGGVDDDFSTINNQRVDDEDLNPSSISRVVHHPTTDLSIHDFTSNTCSEDVAGPPHPEPGPEGVPAYPSDDDISIQETSAAGDALVTDAPTKDESRPTSPMEETPMEETPMEETPYGTLQASLEEVEEQLFVSFTTKEALKLHSCDSSEEAEPQRAEGPHEDGVTERLSVSEDLRRSIETFQDLLLEDLRVMKHRQVIHPVLQEVGLKMNLLDAQFAVNLQYLGVLLPLPPPGPGPGPGQQNQALSPSAAFVSRTGKASAVTQIKGWRERFSPAEAPPPAENCSVQVPAEPQKKRNLSAFCSDMLDQYLETEGKLIGQQVSSFPQPADDAQLYSCSFLPAPGPASQLISAPTPGPATQLISAFVPPSKRLRVPEGKRRGRKPRKPKADPIPQPPGRRRRRKAPPLADPPTNELAPLESDSELGPSSETEGRRDDPTPLETPPLAVATFNYLAPLESDSELPLPPTEADSKMAPPLLEAPPTRRRVVLKQRDLEEAAVWDGHARTAVTDDRASIALTSLFTLKGFVVDDPLAPVQMASRHPPRCLNDFCRLGCVCESLGAVRRPAHCAQASCMFSCSCLKQKVVLLKNLEPPSQLDHSGRKRKKRRKRRMKMAYILKEADCVSAPSPLLRTLWTNQREADPEPLHVPQVLVPSSSQKVRTVTSSCARVRTFPRKKGATEHTAEKATGIEKPGKSIGSAGTPSGSAPKQMMSRRLLVTSDCKWKTEGERSDVLQQLCEALTSQPPQTTFWIKDCLVQVSPPSSKGDTQYKAHISRSKGPGTPGEGRPGPGRPGPGRPGLGRPGPGRPGPGRPRKSQSSVRPEEASDPRQGEEPGERRRLMMKRSALPFLTGVSPAGFLSANRREVGGTKQLVEVNGKFYPLAKIQLGMMGALHPANRLAALLTGRLGSRCSSPSPQHTPPTDTVDLDDNDIMSGEDETVASTETGLSVENTTDSVTDAEEDELNPDPQRHIHNFLEKQRRLQIRDQLHFLRKEIGLVNSKSSEILVLNKAVQLIGQLQEEEVELKQRKSILKRRRDQKLSLISSKEGEELKQVSSEVTADTKEEHNKLSAGGGASDHRVPSHDQLIISQVLPPPVSAPTPPVSAPTPPVSAPPFPVSAPPLLVSAPPPPVSAPPTCSPVQVFLKPPRTTPNILLHNKRPKNTHGEITTNSDGEPSQESSKVSPPEPNVSHLMGKKLVLQSATNSATNIIKVQYSQKQQTPQQQKQTNMNLIKFYISPQTQPLIIKPQTQEIQKQIIQQTLTKQTQPATNTKVIKVHFEPTGQQTQQQGQNTQDTQLQQHIVGLADQQYKQPLQTHQLLLQTQPLQLIGPAVACDPPPATNGWKDATENLQTLLNQLVFFKQATPTVQALPTEVSVGGANQRTEGVELNKLCHTHLDAKALPPLMQMKVDGTKLLDTPMTDTAESGIGGGVEGEVWRPMPRLLKGNPPT